MMESEEFLLRVSVREPSDEYPKVLGRTPYVLMSVPQEYMEVPALMDTGALTLDLELGGGANVNQTDSLVSMLRLVARALQEGVPEKF